MPAGSARHARNAKSVPWFRRWPPVAFLLLCSLLGIASHAQSQGPSLAIQAQQTFNSGHINAAIALWSQMINAGQDIQDGLYNRAQAFLLIRQFQLAYNDLNQLEVMQRPRVRSYTFLLRGIVLNELQNYPAALRDFNLAQKIDNNRLVFANRAVAYQRTGQLVQAEQDLLQAVRMDQSQANIHNLAAIQLSLGKFSDCVNNSSRVLSTYPSFYPAYTVRGMCFFRLGRLEDAVADFLRSTTLNPAQSVASQYLGLALISLGKPDQSRPFLLRAADLSLGENDQVRYQEVMKILSSNIQLPTPKSLPSSP